MNVELVSEAGVGYSQVTVDTWADLLEVFRNFDQGWVFRGQNRAWPLAGC